LLFVVVVFVVVALAEYKHAESSVISVTTNAERKIPWKIERLQARHQDAIRELLSMYDSKHK
jgi:hypothetical protein